MKKIFAILVALATVVAFASCNKNENPSGDKTLEGTSWVATPEEGVNMTISFTTKTECQISISLSPSIIKGTYVYNDPNISITAKDEETAEPKTISGKVEGNKMTLVAPEEEGGTLVFTKK